MDLELWAKKYPKGPRRYCNECRYDTLPYPPNHARCSGCGNDY